MSAPVYELIAMGARYFFAFLGVLIVTYSVLWLRKDAARRRSAMRQLPDAGMVGQIVNEDTGESQPLPREGILGSARDCDVRVPGEGVMRRHAAFAFVEGQGVRFTPILGGQIYEGDEPVSDGETLTHGARFEVGGTRLRIRLFEGLNVPVHAQYAPEAAPWAQGAPVPDAAYMEDEQGTPVQDADYAGDDAEGVWAFAPYPTEAVRGYYEAVQPIDATVRMRPIRSGNEADSNLDFGADPAGRTPYGVPERRRRS